MSKLSVFSFTGPGIKGIPKGIPFFYFKTLYNDKMLLSIKYIIKYKTAKYASLKCLIWPYLGFYIYKKLKEV